MREPAIMLGETSDEFKAEVIAAKHGDVFVYHVGDTATGHLCRQAMILSDAGILALVQRRISYTGYGRFQYEAQRTRNRK